VRWKRKGNLELGLLAARIIWLLILIPRLNKAFPFQLCPSALLDGEKLGAERQAAHPLTLDLDEPDLGARIAGKGYTITHGF
jgi:hypothetical protein